MDHLNNALFYEKLVDDPMERFSEEIMSVLAGMTKRQTLDRDMFDFLKPKKCLNISVLCPTENPQQEYTG